MATVTYSAGFNDLNNWPGRLLEGDDNTTLTNKTATSARITHGAGHDFAGFSITLAGSGFEYDGSTIVDGTLSSVTIKNDSGDIILKITRISDTSIASEVAGIAARILGFTDGDGNVNRQGFAAWSQLLSSNDKVIGTDGDDRSLVGYDTGKDSYQMGGGNDYISGGAGSDTYDGGDGWDTLSFAETT